MGHHEFDTQLTALRASIAVHPLGNVGRLSATDFQVLCRDMEGAFPDLVRASIAGVVPDTIATVTSERARFDFAAPEANPVDFDWRFDDRTAKKLAQLLAGNSNREVLCVGAPTVYDAIIKNGGKAFLIDRNPLLAQTLAAGTFLIDDLSANDCAHLTQRFDVALIDPPWYPEAYDLWLSRTLPLLRSRAELFVVVFRRYTRPSAPQQRERLLTRLERIGRLSFLDVEAVYSTPPFEQAVLTRLELPIMPSWRAADMLKIELFLKPDHSVFDPHAWPMSTWLRFQAGDQVIAVKDSSADCGPISVAHDFPSEVCTVSRRDPTRARYTVWTSRSKAAVVAGTARLAAILGHSANVSIEESDIDVAKKLSRQLGFQIRG